MAATGGRPASPNDFDAKLQAALAGNASLEKEKFRLLDSISRDKKLLTELQQQITILDTQVVERKMKLASYNALFVRMKDADSKAPRQRLGLREAVLGTKRIIQKELDRLTKEAVATELKLNRAKEKNNILRSHINSYRLEQVTFRRLFEKMQAELAEVKAAIATTEAAVEDGYRQRNRVHDEMRESVRQFEHDRAERQQEWMRTTELLESAGTIHANKADPRKGPGSLLTPAEQETLRKKIVRGADKIARDREALLYAREKAAIFNAALARIRSATGYSKLADVVSMFGHLEEEKYHKATTAQRLVEEIEALEWEVSDLRDDVQAHEIANARLKAGRTTTAGQLEANAVAMETALQDTTAAVQNASREVRSLFRVVEFAFRALGVSAGALGPAPSPTGSSGEGGAPVARASSPGPYGDVNLLKSPSPSIAMRAWPGSMTSTAVPETPLFGPAAVAAGSASPMTPSSPDPSGRSSVKRQNSLRMYASNPNAANEVRSGVSTGSLGNFIGIIEGRAAEILQRFAVLATRGEIAAVSDADLLEQLQDEEAAEEARRTATGMDGLEDSLEASLDAVLGKAAGGRSSPSHAGQEHKADDLGATAGSTGLASLDASVKNAIRARLEASGAALGMSPAQRAQMRKRSAAFALGSGEMARRILQPGGLAPLAPPGKVRETIATSALVASLAVDPSRMGPQAGAPSSAASATGSLGGGLGDTGASGFGGGADDDSRPLSVDELKHQAMRRLASDRAVRVLKNAASAAAAVLVPPLPLTAGVAVPPGTAE